MGDSPTYRPSLGAGGSRVAALSIEFVAKPSEVYRVQAALPAAVNGALGEISGFAGSFVLIANHEARLVTVVTLWRGENRIQKCSENLRWVRALLTPYIDRCLRVQMQGAFLSGASAFFSEMERVQEEAISSPAAMMVDESLCVA
ncbi:MAG TPA: hypothetical protein VJN93_02185 [Candidatus Acidoferrum sp.]|nr:hypothetical protein [Candidatus Acidoferrum sp.]